MAVAPGIHIVEEFEKAFQDCLAALTNQDLHNARDSDEIRTSVDLTIQRFLDISKQMDCFFLQKRLLLSVQKPEHLLVENIQELSAEVKRKDELIEKYNSKIQSWLTLVHQDVPNFPSVYPRGPPPPPMPFPQMQGCPSPMQQQPPTPQGGHPQHHMMQHSQSPLSQSQLSQSQLSQAQLSQAQMSQAQLSQSQMAQMPPSQMPQPQHSQSQHSMSSSPASMQQQQGMVMQGGGQMHGGPGGLQGPLAYLERTMSNIDYPSVSKKDSYKFL